LDFEHLGTGTAFVDVGRHLSLRGEGIFRPRFLRMILT
jgi:hypothetical protein